MSAFAEFVDRVEEVVAHTRFLLWLSRAGLIEPLPPAEVEVMVCDYLGIDHAKMASERAEVLNGG